MKRVVDIEVDPENWIGIHRVEVAVEIEIFLIGALSWGFRPKRLTFVDALFAEVDWVGEERAIFFQNRFDVTFIEEIGVGFGDMQGNCGAAALSCAGIEGVVRRAVTRPKGRFCFFLVREGVDGDFVGDHKR